MVQIMLMMFPSNILVYTFHNNGLTYRSVGLTIGSLVVRGPKMV